MLSPEKSCVALPVAPRFVFIGDAFLEQFLYARNRFRRQLSFGDDKHLLHSDIEQEKSG